MMLRLEREKEICKFFSHLYDTRHIQLQFLIFIEKKKTILFYFHGFRFSIVLRVFEKEIFYFAHYLHIFGSVCSLNDFIESFIAMTRSLKFRVYIQKFVKFQFLHISNFTGSNFDGKTYS